MVILAHMSRSGTLFDGDIRSMVGYTIDDSGNATGQGGVGTIEDIAPEDLQYFKNVLAPSLELSNGDVIQISLLKPEPDGSIKFSIHPDWVAANDELLFGPDILNRP